MLLLTIRLLLSLVFTGWLVMWVILPTNFYQKSWQPKLSVATANSEYIGQQGRNILMFASPVLFIATLGCVYLHLAKRRDTSWRLSPWVDSWRRPFLVKGPLGVLSGMEVTFCLMFLALIVWSLWVYLSTSFPHLDPPEGEDMWKWKFKTAALRLAFVGNLCCAFIFFPVSRGSSLFQLVGLTSDASIKYHVWLGHTVMTFFTAHSACCVISWVGRGKTSQMLEWATTEASNIAGELALVVGLVMWAMAIPRIRRKAFELFFYTHHLYILFLFFYLMHVGFTYFCYILPGIYLFMVDRYLRFLQSRQCARLLSARLLPSDIVELNFAKSAGFSYTSMSSVFINVPSISLLQSHPFTVSSSSGLEPDKLSVIIKKEGRWTQRLFQELTSPNLDRLNVSVEGPYGPARVVFFRHDSLVMVSGGSGITPFISIIRDLIHRSMTSGSSPTPSILLICSFKTFDELMMLDLLLPISGSYDLSNLQLRVEAFVTRDKTPSDDPNKLIRAVWFKPNPSDSPIAPVLGPNGWLWLGAIITSSFASFLLIMGIINRYYIYPIDKNTEKVYSYTWRSLLNMMFICLSIIVVSSLAVLWNKRSVAREGKRTVQMMDASCPSASPSSWFYNAERELESVPCESLRKATNVHYGKRPDLKMMLLQCREPNVGIMASGPPELRREVAAICSSGLANNLHYEALSFVW